MRKLKGFWRLKEPATDFILPGGMNMRRANLPRRWDRIALITLLVSYGVGLVPIESRSLLIQPVLAASPLDGVIEGARKEGKLIIYESQPAEAWSKIMAVFQKRYPFIKEWNQERLTASDVPTRIANESRAAIPTADVFGNTPPTTIPLIKRNLVAEVDWKALGVPEKTIYNRYTVLGNMFAYVIGYNKRFISSTDAPKTWEDLLDPKWKGRGGWWRLVTRGAH